MGARSVCHVTGEHVAGVVIERKPVQAGAIRFAHGAPETHSVEYLGNAPMEYARIELRTEPLDRPVRDVRLPALAGDLSCSSMTVRFENRQVRILHVACAAGQRCPESDHPGNRAVVVTLSGKSQGRIAVVSSSGRGSAAAGAHRTQEQAGRSLIVNGGRAVLRGVPAVKPQRLIRATNRPSHRKSSHLGSTSIKTRWTSCAS